MAEQELKQLYRVSSDQEEGAQDLVVKLHNEFLPRADKHSATGVDGLMATPAVVATTVEDFWTPSPDLPLLGEVSTPDLHVFAHEYAQKNDRTLQQLLASSPPLPLQELQHQGGWHSATAGQPAPLQGVAGATAAGGAMVQTACSLDAALPISPTSFRTALQPSSYPVAALVAEHSDPHPVQAPPDFVLSLGTATATKGHVGHTGRRSVSSANHNKQALAQLEHQLQVVSSQFSQLAMENKKLKDKLQMCEVLLPLREQQISSAAGLPPVDVASVKQDNKASASSYQGPASISSSVLTTSSMPTTAASTDQPAEQVPPRPTNCAALPCINQSYMRPPATVAEVVQRAFALGVSVPSQPPTDAEFRQLYLGFQKSAAHVLAAWNTYPTAAVAEQLESMMVDLFRNVVVAVGVLDPTVYRRNMYINMETGEKDFPGDGFWLGVAQQMKRMHLTAEQLAHTKVAVTAYDEEMKPVLAERAELGTKLSASLAAGGDEQAVIAEGLIVKIEENMKKEAKARTTAHNYVGMTALTVPVYACMLVHCYPYMPDDIALMKAVLQLHDMYEPAASLSQDASHA